MTRPLEVALVGCGAIAQRGYLPALGRVPEVRCRWLVDVDQNLAYGLGMQFGVPNSTDDYQSALGEVEAVILAVPTRLHAPMAVGALGQGRAVLCEKPLGTTVKEVRKMVAASEEAGVPLVAGMIFRQYPGLQQIQAAFPWDSLGRIREVRASYGCPLDWPVSNPSFFDREMAGGGVLLDLGVHLLDALFWVLSVEDASAAEYFDDGESGMESEAKASLTVRVAENNEAIRCLLEVSRLRRLGNCIEVKGEKASLLIPLSSSETPRLQRNRESRLVFPHPVPRRSEIECFGEQIKAFAKSVRGLQTNVATGKGQVQVLRIIESCFGVRKPLAFPWENYAPWN